MPAIKDNLKALRNIRGLSQNDVAEALNVTRQTISSYETGRTEPDLEMLKEFADLYNADINDILYGSNRQQKRIKRICNALYIISAVFLLCLLIVSVLFLIKNTCFFPGTERILYPNDTVWEKHLLLRNIADWISIAGLFVFRLGYLVMIYPIITIRSAFSLKKLTVFALILLIVMHIIPLPFMLLDKISGYGDYYFPVIQAMPGLVLFYLVQVIVHIADKIKKKK